MRIISHRGYWTDPAERNAPVAFARSFDKGYGTETDVRDDRGRLVIAHDMPTGDEMSLDDMLDILDGRPLPLAINIKADGLSARLAERMAARGVRDWFSFDMSVPELLVQLRGGLPVYTRTSEHERPPVALDRAHGVWLDAFDGTWFDAGTIRDLLGSDRAVCIVSPELHRRDPASLWALLRDAGLSRHDRLMLCTDRPEDATAFFGDPA